MISFTVNLLQVASMVRIRPPPPNTGSGITAVPELVILLVFFAFYMIYCNVMCKY